MIHSSPSQSAISLDHPNEPEFKLEPYEPPPDDLLNIAKEKAITEAQADFLLCDMLGFGLKSDQPSLEVPIFSLTTKRRDLTEGSWQSQDGKRYINIVPSVRGRATQLDKDILIFVISQIIEAKKRGHEKANSRTVRFKTYNYLVSTLRSTGGTDYTRFVEALTRLKGTQILTNITTNSTRQTDSFGLIENWKVVEGETNITDDGDAGGPVKGKAIAVEITLSEWLYQAVSGNEVLTLNFDYFKLTKPLERRLYEIARKHCGRQAMFRISLVNLHLKTGSSAKLRNFRDDLARIIKEDPIPDYRYSLTRNSADTAMVTIYTKDVAQFAEKQLAETKKRFSTPI